jgi:hypothetical protein
VVPSVRPVTVKLVPPVSPLTEVLDSPPGLVPM